MTEAAPQLGTTLGSSEVFEGRVKNPSSLISSLSRAGQYTTQYGGLWGRLVGLLLGVRVRMAVYRAPGVGIIYFVCHHRVRSSEAFEGRVKNPSHLNSSLSRAGHYKAYICLVAVVSYYMCFALVFDGCLGIVYGVALPLFSTSWFGYA